MDGGSMDIIQCLGQDVSLYILMRLEEPIDLLRTSAVSRSWRDFVIFNGLLKKLCLKMFPEVSCFARVIVINNMIGPVASGTDHCVERDEHRVYASLCRNLTNSNSENCISDAICASSTDNFPEESIKNTLEPRDRVDRMPCYWSSKGARNPSVPETLIYKLASQLCVITEFHVHPFQAFFQYGDPIYSAKAVRLQIGQFKGSLDVESVQRNGQNIPDDKFVWTYSSSEFPMVQENCLQKFKLPEPVICFGGILKLELLGRMQTQEEDARYYICINHVQVVGKRLSPAFDVGMIDEQGKCTLSISDCTFNDASEIVIQQGGGNLSRKPR